MHAVSLSTILGLIPPVLQTWLFFLLVRRRLVRRFPFFFAYTVFAVLAEVLKGVLLYRNSRGWAYFYVAWGVDALYAVLGFLAMVEVFQHVFANFFYLRWFKFLMPAVGAGMLGTAVLIAVVHPPVDASRWAHATWTRLTPAASTETATVGRAFVRNCVALVP